MSTGEHEHSRRGESSAGCPTAAGRIAPEHWTVWEPPILRAPVPRPVDPAYTATPRSSPKSHLQARQLGRPGCRRWEQGGSGQPVGVVATGSRPCPLPTGSDKCHTQERKVFRSPVA